MTCAVACTPAPPAHASAPSRCWHAALPQVRAKVIIDGKLNPNIVGQSITKLADLFGITVPPGTKVLIGEVDKIGKEEPLSEVGR